MQLNHSPRMNAPCPCTRAKTDLRKMKHGAGWIVPGIMLALIPKCPLCFAAWFSLLFGISLSTPAATFLRTCAIVLCSLLFLTFIARHLVTWFHTARLKPH